jgi:sporulation protein YlmC with PRC-barrel domain
MRGAANTPPRRNAGNHPLFLQGDPAMTTATGHTNAILASRVTGTKVCDASGRNVGEVKDIVLDKTSNNIMFAIVSFGGFLGMGEKYHALPWAELDYDPSSDAYIVSWTKEQLQAAPSDSLEELTRDDGMNYRNRAFDYYKTPRYW